MIKDRITYSESVETFQENGLKRWTRAEMSATVSEGENPLVELEELKKDIKTFLRPSLPITESNGQAEGVIPVINKEKERVEIAIDNASTKEELALHFDTATKYNLINQWMAKHNELSK